MLADVQRLILQALLSDDPRATLHRQLQEAACLSEQERAWLCAIEPAGLILAGLLVKKLRFERLTRADPEMVALFERKPQHFMRLFARYAADVPPTSFFPRQEANQFQGWRAQHPDL